MTIPGVSPRLHNSGFEFIDYACRERDGSLKPGPVKEYCLECQFEFRCRGCLFAPTWREGETDQDLAEMRRQAGRHKAAAARAEGLNSAGQPLTPSCWNCESLRQRDGGYVCKWEPEEKPFCRATAARSRTVEKTGCDLFGMRLEMEIPPLDGEESRALGGGE